MIIKKKVFELVFELIFEVFFCYRLTWKEIPSCPKLSEEKVEYDYLWRYANIW